MPEKLVQARGELHRAAIEWVSPQRERVTGRIDLRATAGGFGTPVFDGDREVRVDGIELVTIGRGVEKRMLIGDVDEVAARWLGRYFALALHVLSELSRDLPREWAPSPPKLWPEHFDYAIDAGLVRANLGFSPGDETHDEPYAYVGPWEARPEGPLWNARGFPGAEVAVTDLDRPAGELVAWLRERLDALHAG